MALFGFVRVIEEANVPRKSSDSSRPSDESCRHVRSMDFCSQKVTRFCVVFGLPIRWECNGNAPSPNPGTMTPVLTDCNIPAATNLDTNIPDHPRHSRADRIAELSDICGRHRIVREEGRGKRRADIRGSLVGLLGWDGAAGSPSQRRYIDLVPCVGMYLTVWTARLTSMIDAVKCACGGQCAKEGGN